jgi:hypothetical protein
MEDLNGRFLLRTQIDLLLRVASWGEAPVERMRACVIGGRLDSSQTSSVPIAVSCLHACPNLRYAVNSLVTWAFF